MLENILEIKKINGNDVYFRKDNNQVNNKAIELEKIIKYLTNEHFEEYAGKRYKRRLVSPGNFEIIEKYPLQYDFDSDDEMDNFTCLCSENTCNHLIIIKHIPTDIYMAVGSVCYTRFNEENITDIYYHCKAKRCNCCKVPLVFKQSKFTKKYK